MIKKLIKKILPAKIISSLKKTYLKIKSGLYLVYFSLMKYVYRLIRLIHRPALPKNKDGKICLHLGCGNKNDPRFINIDADAYPNVHFIQNIENLNNFASNSADLIYATHVLEHISHRKLVSVLKEWYRVIKPGGMIRISVPDFDILIEAYRNSGNNLGHIMEPLMGGQNYENNYHRSAFTEKYLSELFNKVGFSNIKRWDALKSDYKFDDFSKFKGSLNLEANKIQ